MNDTQIEIEEREKLDKLLRRFLLLFIIPLILIIILTSVSIFLTIRVSSLKNQSDRLEAMQEWNLIERVVLKEKNYKWAIHQLETLVKKYPYPLFLSRLGGLHINFGDPDRGIDILIEESKSDDPHWEVFSHLHYYYLVKDKDDEKARIYAEKALKLNTFDAQTHNNIAWLYANSDNTKIRNMKKAKDHANKAVDYTRSKNPCYFETLAQVYMKSGEHGLALDAIDKAIKLEGNPLGRYKDLREEIYPKTTVNSDKES